MNELEIGDSFMPHDALKVSLARFACHAKDVKEAVVIIPPCEPPYKHMAAVVRVGEDVVVKYGPYVSAKEQETIRFIAENTPVPVPQVYGVHEGDDGNTYIVMEFISGTPLDLVWDSLEVSQKEKLAHQLREYFEELRELRGNFIGSVHEGPCKDIYFDEGADKGPFTTEVDMNVAIVEAVRKGSGLTEDFVTCTLPGLPHNHAIVFSHGNFGVTHVIVDSEHENVRAIVGWQRSGFFPEYWDFVNALTLTIAPFRSDWVLYVEKILKPYYDEYPHWCQLRMSARWRRQMAGRC
ncbi:unnamed protein product [Chondrus crispus]|uniref:Aminoglycoside phosphotransferase domain-containing protein n=1 Tax=Chondrus crispus TaxID=2769 RepID=R7QLP4_CHOCR|nr:unnamed protein product [Chondrus crispus]CDF38703.1 unnamed protein product [Chondrus crispus]|eukprot:XP_005718608.1 unnamed protein product [Chondrus crispus]